MVSLPKPRLYKASTDKHLLESIAELDAACIEIDHTLATFLPPLSHEKILASWTTWTEEVSAGRRIIVVQLAEESSQVAGVASLYMPDTETGSHRGEVGRLLVSPSYRKRGLARVLMTALEAEARDLGRWMLVRSCFNAPSGHVRVADYYSRLTKYRHLTRPLEVVQSMCIPNWATRKWGSFQTSVSVQKMAVCVTRCSSTRI